jgi:hypothetical protein
VGGPGDNNNAGAAWIYTRAGSKWTQQGSKLTGSDATADAAAGFNVALSSDGNTALIGGPRDNNGAGAVWAFSPGQAPVTHALSVTVAGAGSGTVIGSGISCPGTCAQTYADGATVTLTATPAAGSTFSGWSGACSGTGPCTLTMTSDLRAKATFGPAGRSTPPAGGGNGAQGTPEPQGPVLTALKISPRTLVLTGRFARGVCVAATHANHARPVCTRPIKSRISYRLNAAANVTFTIQRVLTGRRLRGACVKPSARLRRHASCRRLVKVGGKIVRAGDRGNNAFIFNDQIGGRKLGPGTYVLTATPSAGGQSGTAQTVTFTVAR